MATNLVESVQQKLNVEELQKIDPDTGEVFETDKPKNKFYQLAIPAILTGLYGFTRIDEGDRNILNGNAGNLISSIFGEKKNDVISKIANISSTPLNVINEKFEKIGEAIITTLKEHLPKTSADSDVKNFLTSQRHHILSYLDPALQLGQYLKDDTIDDSTNKMEGPVSGLMHNLGQIFSESGNDKKEEI